MKAYLNITQWAKLGKINEITFIAKEAIAYASGCFIVFINLSSGEEFVYTANAHCINGDGVRVLTGHKSAPVFAYTENCMRPTLYVKNYPAMETICRFKDGPADGYSALDFSESSLLVALGDLPNFSITVWNWREKEQYAGLAKSPLLVENQLIRCSWGKPAFIIQMGKGTNKVIIWDAFSCCKKTVLAKHVVRIPKIGKVAPFSKAVWTTEGTAMIVDLRGSVYIVDSEFVLERVIEMDLEGDSTTNIDWYKSGIVVSGPNNAIRHYKKSGAWTCDWIIDLDFGLREIISNKSDYLYGVTSDNQLVKMSNIDGVTYLKENDSRFTDFGLVYPLGSYIVALRARKYLTVYETETGKMVGEYEAQKIIKSMVENPEFCYVALGYDDGLVELISIYKPDRPSLMTSFHLCSQPMQCLKFFEQGRILVAAFLDTGSFFVIDGIPGTRMNVVAHVDTKCQIVDFMMVSSANCHRLFVIPVTTNYLAGNKIVRYCIISKDNVGVKEYSLESKDVYYHRLMPATHSLRDRTFYALPFASKTVHVLETKRGEPLAKKTGQIKTGHQLSNFEFRLTRNFATTWGYDGFVIVRNGDFSENVALALPHHRYLGGVQKAYIDPLGQYIVSLGRDNTMACTKIASKQVDENLRAELNLFVESTKYKLMFKRPTLGFKPEGRFENLTWIEKEAILLMDKEERACRQAKEAILKDFEEIKNVLKKLVTKNLEGPENEKIDLLEFYLDTGAYNQKKLQNKENCRNTELYLKALILAQDKVSNYLMTNYINTMGVPGKTIRGFFVNTATHSFTLLPPKEYNLSHYAWVEEQRKIEQILVLNDSFEPWHIVPKETLLKQLQQPLKLATQDYTRLVAKTFLEENVVSQDNMESQVALTGSVAQIFIDKSLGHYKQSQLTTFYQCQLQDSIALQERYKLRLVYNDSFDKLMEQKCRKMESILDKNAKLRHIISEYNYFSKEKIHLEIKDPEWTQEEQPWMINKVTNKELTTTPYISPAEQAILDAKAAEEERIRLALLADDFRERALMTMMNGVLEIRWEDELKKEVPLPKCMVEKDPAQFNEEDLRAIKSYEEKVAFLNSERERYKNILDVDFTKTAYSVKDTIRKFNQKLRGNIEFKFLLASGLCQEYLKVDRARVSELERVDLYIKEKELLKAIRENENVIEQLQKLVDDMKEQLSNCKTSLDTLANKEKLLDKAFKRDFQEANQIIQEQAVKLYKRRPKANYRQINIESLLFELAKCIITQEKSLILTNDCLEYIKALDVLDQFVGLPPTIDENTYNLICKHRRLRLEYEIKLRAIQTQISDGETSIATFQKRIGMKKEKNTKLLQEIHKVRSEYQTLMHNVQVQIVLRRGIVELPLNGDISDFQDAIFVHKKEIEEINSKIRDAGNKKLHTIMRNMAFRRNIMAKEWEHQKLRMEINDLIEQMKDIEDIKFTREMQLYLKGKHLGRKFDNDSFEQEIEVMSSAFENLIRDKKEKWLKLMKQIRSYKEHNKILNEQIENINIDVCDLKLQQDVEIHSKENDMVRARMDDLLRRSSLVQQIQQSHNEILVLQTELELLRLRTYPTFKYKLIHPDE